MNDRLSSNLASLRISHDAPPAVLVQVGAARRVIAVIGGLGVGGAVLVPQLSAKVWKTEVRPTG